MALLIDVSSMKSRATPVRVLHLLGIRELEGHLYLHENRHGPLSPDTEDLVDEISRNNFEITEFQTKFKFPKEYEKFDQFSKELWHTNNEHDKHEAQFETEGLTDEETVEFFIDYKWDFKGDDGFPLRCTKLFRRQAEAVIKGIMGKLPDLKLIDEKHMESTLTRDRDAFIAKRKSH